MKVLISVGLSLVFAGSAFAAEPAAWISDLRREAAAKRIAEPQLAARVLALEGVQPAKYLARRRPEPEVGRELAQQVLRKGGDVFVLELALGGAADYGFAARAAYPATMSDGEVARLRGMERLAIEEGAAVALGKSKHAAAPLVLEQIAADDARPIGVRAAAATALGETRSAGARDVLVRIASAANAPSELRAAAIAGIGLAGGGEAIEALAPFALGADEALARAAIAGIGSAADAWRLKRDGAGAGADQIAARAAAVLVRALVARGELEANVLEACAVIASPAARAVIERELGAQADAATKGKLDRARARMLRRS